MINGNIASILIFILSLIFVRVLNKLTKNNKMTIFIYIIALCLFSYFYKPLTAVDLTRQQETLKLYSGYSFLEIIPQIIKTTDFSRLFLFWFVSKIGDPNILQVIASLTFYSCVFYIIYDYCKIINNDRLFIKLLTIFMLFGQFIFVISGIRTAMAFSIFSLCFYSESFKNKSFFSNIFFYIIAIGFHSSVVPVFLIRVILLMLEKRKNYLFYLIITICFSLILLYFGSDIANSTFLKANEYIFNSTFYNKPEYLLSMIEFLLFLFLIINSIKLNNNEFKGIKKYRLMIIFLLLISLLCSFQYTIFTRYIRLLEILILPFIGLLFNFRLPELRKNVYPLYYLIIIIFMILIVIVSFFKANMSVFNLF